MLSLLRLIHGAECGFRIRRGRVVGRCGRFLGSLPTDMEGVCRMHAVDSGYVLVVRRAGRRTVVAYGDIAAARQALLNLVNL